ncbi:ArsR/SmtB family transcription factor [Mycolicibacterium septicum]|uniref:ArsR/SmtB family transcription factor n=1 Tax=Mycolicibacterium septicum TaxID=98668 RepID=A0ABW9LSW4_9MYCO|nr:metalloregulator ArsR/SmtB family transcription factor [Mycobacteriaceae bacterium Msp059]
MERSAAKTRLYEAFAASGKALAHASRLELLDLLSQGERSVDSLARSAGLNLTTASAHLQTLKQAGFVDTRRDGTKVFYRLAGVDVAELFALLRSVAESHQPTVRPAREAYLGRPDEQPSIGRDEITAGRGAVLLDVRPVEEYLAGHIPGAISIPVDELAERITDLPDDSDIIVYCRGEYCVFAYDAVRLLNQNGRRAIRLNDGMLEWRLAGLPVASGDE